MWSSPVPGTLPTPGTLPVSRTLLVPGKRHGRQTVGLAFAPEWLFACVGDGRWTLSPLPEGFLDPSPETANLASTADAARIVETALATLAPGPASFRNAVIALPDRSVHMARVEGPRSFRSGKLGGDLLRELIPDAAPGGRADSRYRVDWMATGDGGRRSLLGAAVRTTVVRQYERVAEAVGLDVRWVDAESLAVAPEWLGAGGGKRTLVLLQRRHFVVLHARDGHVAGFRFKLRSAGDPRAVALVVGQSAPPSSAIHIRGEGASEVAGFLDDAGHRVVESRAPTPGGPPTLAHLALAALLRRAGVRPAALRREAA